MQKPEQPGVFQMAIYPGLGDQVLELAEGLAAEEQEPLVAAARAAAGHGALYLGVGPNVWYAGYGLSYPLG